MEKIIQRFPTKLFTYCFHVFAVSLACANISGCNKIWRTGYSFKLFFFLGITGIPSNVNIFIQFRDPLKSRYVYVQMNWLLIKKEYIIVFVCIVSTIIYYAVWITPAKWFTNPFSKSRKIFSNPGPEGVVIKFIYSNHV